MNNLKIDNNSSRSEIARWLIPLIIVILSSFAVCIGCLSKQTKDSKQHIYMPDTDKSVISRTNDLLSHMLENENKSIRIKSIDDLNRKYPGLVFDTPETNVDVEYIRTTDIRLVDVKPQYIKNRGSRKWYNNSNLADLLKKQRENMGLAFFRIKMSKDAEGYYTISSITVVPSVFRTRLDNMVSHSTIVSNSNNLFSSSDFCFLIWRDQVIPIKKQENDGVVSERSFSVNTHPHYFYHLSPNVPLSLLDIDSLYRDHDGNLRVRINWQDNGYIILEYLPDGKMSIKTGNRLNCIAYECGRMPVSIKPKTSSRNPTILDFDNDIRLVFGQGDCRTEVVLSHVNPLTILASANRSNAGVSRYTISPTLTDNFSQQVIGGLESLLAQYDYNDTVRLTLDPILAKYFEKELEGYTRQLMRRPELANGSWDVSMTVMDISTGDILAMPYYRSEDEKISSEVAFTRKNPALLRRFPGSTFKPMIALASVVSCPELLNLDTRGHYRLIDTDSALFYNYRTSAWAKKTPGHWNGRSSMTEFLAYSCDVYPVALTALSLNGGNRDLVNGGNRFFYPKDHELWVDRDRTLSEQGLMRNLDILYDINSDSEEHDSIDRMDYYMWRNLTSDTAHFSDNELLALDILSPAPVVMSYSKISQGCLRKELATWILGQGTNEWNCVKLAEAWCRMLSKQEVKASMVRISEGTESRPSILGRLGDGANNTWNVFLEFFRNAQTIPGGTVFPMQSVVSDLNRSESHLRDNPLVLFSKTGTPNNYERREFNNLNQDPMVLDVAMYTFGLLKNSEYQNVINGQPAKGVVCVLRFTRTVKKSDAYGDGLWSMDARNFFSNHPYRLTNLYHLIEHYL